MLMHENTDELQPSLTDLIKKLSKVDLVLVEVLNREASKIEVVRKARDHLLQKTTLLFWLWQLM